MQKLTPKHNAIFIGRFQPFHNGHLSILKNATTHDDIDSITLLIGSVNQDISLKNPLTFGERKTMIEQAITEYNQSHQDKIENVSYAPLNDYFDEPEKWFEEVRKLSKDSKYIIGHDKDESTFYLKEFPELKVVSFDAYNGYNSLYKNTLNATQIREHIYAYGYNPDLSYVQDIPTGTAEFIKWWVQSSNYRYLRSKFLLG